MSELAKGRTGAARELKSDAWRRTRNKSKEQGSKEQEGAEGATGIEPGTAVESSVTNIPSGPQSGAFMFS
jgi:hypothetical protein